MKISDFPQDKCPFCWRTLIRHDKIISFLYCPNKNSHYHISYDSYDGIIKIVLFLSQLEVWIFHTTFSFSGQMLRVFNRQDEVVLDLSLENITITDFSQLEQQLQTLINFQ